ncbi:MAG: hypothetical protein IRZ08_21125 [Frankia sp.]|nr:hypothetical protein [Frankia sp.]
MPGPWAAPVAAPVRSGRRRWLIIGAAAGVFLAAAAATGTVLATMLTSDDASPTVAAPTVSLPPAAATDVLPGAWTPGQIELAGRLDPAALADCRPNPVPGSPAVSAALFCVAEDGRLVSVFGYPDVESVRADIRTRSAAAAQTDGDCAGGEDAVFEWDTGDSTPVGGTVICHARGDQHFLYWTVDEDRAAFLAYDADPAALYAWWETFEPL